MQILSISIPATFIGVVIAGLWSINRGKDLDKDSEFQEKSLILNKKNLFTAACRNKAF